MGRYLKSVKMMMLKMFMPSVPKMPGGDDGEKKEESAESREEAKEQERLRQQAIKDAEKERAQFYAKQKEGQKDVRAKYREKVNVVSYKKALGRHLKCYSIRL